MNVHRAGHQFIWQKAFSYGITESQGLQVVAAFMGQVATDQRLFQITFDLSNGTLMGQLISVVGFS